MKMYPPETVIAEKLEAMTKRGLGTTRLKDFYDLWMLSETREFDGAMLGRALASTFDRRETPLPTAAPPIALTPAFATDPTKRAQWHAFLDRNDLHDAPRDLVVVIDRLSAFLWPVLSGDGVEPARPAVWRPGRGWQPID